MATNLDFWSPFKLSSNILDGMAWLSTGSIPILCTAVKAFPHGCNQVLAQCLKWRFKLALHPWSWRCTRLFLRVAGQLWQLLEGFESVPAFNADFRCDYYSTWQNCEKWLKPGQYFLPSPWRDCQHRDIRHTWGVRGPAAGTAHQAAILAIPSFGSPQDTTPSAMTVYLFKCPSNSVRVGIPFYGRGYNAVSPGSTCGLGQSFKDDGGSMPSYDDIMSGGYNIYHDGSNYNAAYGLEPDGTFVSFEDKVSLSAKLNYTMNAGMAGAFYWISGYDKNGDLINLAYAALQSESSPVLPGNQCPGTLHLSSSIHVNHFSQLALAVLARLENIKSLSTLQARTPLRFYFLVAERDATVLWTEFTAAITYFLECVDFYGIAISSYFFFGFKMI